jgi:hypothetical protein
MMETEEISETLFSSLIYWLRRVKCILHRVSVRVRERVCQLSAAFEGWPTDFYTTASNKTKRKQEVLGRTNRLLSLIRHRPHWKQRVQQFFYCCVCILYRCNVSTEPLSINDRGIFTKPLPSNDKRSFTEPLPSNDRGILRHTHTHSSVIS